MKTRKHSLEQPADVVPRLLLRSAGFTLTEAARRLGVSSPFLSLIISGRRKWPRRVLLNFCRLVRWPDPAGFLQGQEVILKKKEPAVHA